MRLIKKINLTIFNLNKYPGTLKLALGLLREKANKLTTPQLFDMTPSSLPPQ